MKVKIIFKDETAVWLDDIIRVDLKEDGVFTFKKNKTEIPVVKVHKNKVYSVTLDYDVIYSSEFEEVSNSLEKGGKNL